MGRRASQKPPRQPREARRLRRKCTTHPDAPTSDARGRHTLLLYRIHVYKASKSEWPWLWPSRSLKLKCDGAICLSIYGFLLIYIVTICLTFQFIHRVKWLTLNLRKIVNRKFQKSRRVLLWGLVRKKFRKNFGKIQKWFEWGEGFWTFGSFNVLC